jgi:hypothetical protein
MTQIALRSLTGRNGESGGRTADVLRGKGFAGLLGLLLLGATLAPIAQNWQAEPKDSFPFSYYPMFSQKRGDVYKVDYIVGLDAQGGRHMIPYTFAGRGGFNQTRRQIHKLIQGQMADTLCRAVATHVRDDDDDDAAEGGASYSSVVTVQIVTGAFRFADYFGGNKTPVEESVHAACSIVR